MDHTKHLVKSFVVNDLPYIFQFTSLKETKNHSKTSNFQQFIAVCVLIDLSRCLSGGGEE